MPTAATNGCCCLRICLRSNPKNKSELGRVGKSQGRRAVRTRLVFQGRFLSLGVSCGEDLLSTESPAKVSARVETTRRKLNPARCDETPLVAIRTRAPTTTPPNGHSTHSLTAIGLGSGHQAENRIAKLRCAAKSAGLAPASEEGDD